MDIKKWASRICILFGDYAVKIPHRLIWWLHNKDEVIWYDQNANPYLYWSYLWWLVVVWERCLPAQYYWNSDDECWKRLYKLWNSYYLWWWRPEKKWSSFGIAKKGRVCRQLVAVDFAPLYICSNCKKKSS